MLQFVEDIQEFLGRMEEITNFDGKLESYFHETGVWSVDGL